jgi:hypothetical protein
MPYYAYLASHAGTNTWAPERIVFIDVVKGRKDGKQRLKRLLEKHKDLLPQDGWKQIMHRTLATEDNAVIEKLKNRVRLKIATLAITSSGERRLWADKPGAPAGCYRITDWEANKVFLDELYASGLYKTPGRQG